jgi:hypothetical protein
MCNRIRVDLQDRLDETRAREAAGLPPPNHYTPTAKQIEQQLKEFEDLIQDIPQGFRLAPVLYSRITPEENAEIHSEYQFAVRPRFLRFLAENHADDLRALGICEHGIDRMKNGLDPANAQGVMYDVNIDHIAERSGSGLWGKSKEADPDRPGAAPTSHANHFGNFILLPKQVHEYKNKLNDIQHITRTPPGECMWTLMIVPERNDVQAGFVCPPQPPGHAYSDMKYRKTDPQSLINHGIFLLSTVAEEMRAFKQTPGLAAALQGFEKAAAKEGKSVSKAANDDIRDKKAPGLRRLFNEAVAQYPAAEKDLDTLIRPGLTDAARHMNVVFERVAKNRNNGNKSREAWQRFVKTMQGKNMRDFRKNAESLPLRESTALYFALRRIDLAIRKINEDERALQGLQAPPANNNGGIPLPGPGKSYPRAPLDTRAHGKKTRDAGRQGRKGKKSKNKGKNRRFGT